MRFVAIIVLLFIMTAVANAADETVDADFWVATLDVEARQFRFRIEPVTDADGSIRHQLVSVDEGNQVFRLDDFRLDDTRLTFELKATKASYAGEISDSGKKSTGKWEQRGQTFDFF